jgi:hypothetical protein
MKKRRHEHKSKVVHVLNYLSTDVWETGCIATMNMTYIYKILKILWLSNKVISP